MCILFLISGKIEVENVISKKLQLKMKAEVSNPILKKLCVNTTRGSHFKLEGLRFPPENMQKGDK